MGVYARLSVWLDKIISMRRHDDFASAAAAAEDDHEEEEEEEEECRFLSGFPRRRLWALLLMSCILQFDLFNLRLNSRVLRIEVAVSYRAGALHQRTT